MSSHSVERIFPSDLSAPPMVDRWRSRWLPVAGIFTILAVIGAFTNLPNFLRAYLTSFMLVWGVSMGSMALLMVQYLTGGKWSITNRRIFEAAARNLPLTALMFLPILFGAPKLYAWIGQPTLLTEEAAHALHWKHFWMNYPFWIVRTVVCFAIWIVIYQRNLTKWSLQRDADTRDSLLRWQFRFENLSGFGLVVYALTLTVVSVDWVMSLDITWYSTIYGLIFLVGQGLSAIALGIICTTLLSRDEPMASLLRLRELHDNGKLLFAFTMLFAYISFSQFLIIWMGNLPDEIHWYNQRIHGGWGFIAAAVALFHFALPWLVLLSRDVKRHSKALRRIAYYMIFMRFVDTFWHVQPAFSYNEQHKLVSVNMIEAGKFAPHFTFPWQYAVVPVALGGWWIVSFCSNLRRFPLIPINDPQVHELLQSEHSNAAV